MRLCEDGGSGIGGGVFAWMGSTRLAGIVVVGWFTFGEIGRERLKD